MPNRPILVSMPGLRADTSIQIRESELHLLRTCLAMGYPASRRAPAKVRLEEALGRDLTRHLLRSLRVTRP